MDHIHPVWRLIFNQIMDISSLSIHDFVSIVAHYNDMFEGDKSKPSSELEKRGYPEAALAHASKKLTDQFVAVKSVGIQFNKPFSHLKFALMSYILTLFENYERGCLPYPGSVSEQPALIMECFSVLQVLKQEMEVKISEKIKSNGRHKHPNQSRASR